jgi:hypothetical protein
VNPVRELVGRVPVCYVSDVLVSLPFAVFASIIV